MKLTVCKTFYFLKLIQLSSASVRLANIAAIVWGEEQNWEVVEMSSAPLQYRAWGIFFALCYHRSCFYLSNVSSSKYERSLAYAIPLHEFITKAISTHYVSGTAPGAPHRFILQGFFPILIFKPTPERKFSNLKL